MKIDYPELALRALATIAIALLLLLVALIPVSIWNTGQANRQILLRSGIDMPWYRAAAVKLSASEINALVRTEEKK